MPRGWIPSLHGWIWSPMLVPANQVFSVLALLSMLFTYSSRSSSPRCGRRWPASLGDHQELLPYDVHTPRRVLIDLYSVDGRFHAEVDRICVPLAEFTRIWWWAARSSMLMSVCVFIACLRNGWSYRNVVWIVLANALPSFSFCGRCFAATVSLPADTC